MFRTDEKAIDEWTKAFSKEWFYTLEREWISGFVVLLSRTAQTARRKNGSGKKAVGKLASYLLSCPSTGSDGQAIKDLCFQGLRAFGVEDLVTTAAATATVEKAAAIEASAVAAIVEKASSTMERIIASVFPRQTHRPRPMEIAYVIGSQMAGKFDIGWSRRFNASERIAGDDFDGFGLRLHLARLFPSSSRAKSRS